MPQKLFYDQVGDGRKRSTLDRLETATTPDQKVVVALCSDFRKFSRNFSTSHHNGLIRGVHRSKF